MACNINSRLSVFAFITAQSFASSVAATLSISTHPTSIAFNLLINYPQPGACMTVYKTEVRACLVKSRAVSLTCHHYETRVTTRKDRKTISCTSRRGGTPLRDVITEVLLMTLLWWIRRNKVMICFRKYFTFTCAARPEQMLCKVFAVFARTCCKTTLQFVFNAQSCDPDFCFKVFCSLGVKSGAFFTN